MENNMWEDQIYKNNLHNNIWPYPQVISKVMRYFQELKSPSDFRILELGCGVGNNVIALAQMGFHVTGVDFSANAIEKAKLRAREKNVQIDLFIGAIEDFDPNTGPFDLVFDRGAFVCLSDSKVAASLEKVNNYLKPGGLFLGFDWYGKNQPDIEWGTITTAGTYDNFLKGRFVNQGEINFVDKPGIERFFKDFNGDLRISKVLETNQLSVVLSEIFNVEFQKSF
jgi:cyclopropane fatty-acyl-phospholipid synthase-like methyltransferase